MNLELKMETNKQIIRVVIILDHECNLNCKYCQIKKDRTEMSQETIAAITTTS